MIPMTLQQAASHSNGVVLAPVKDQETVFTAVATDTRKSMVDSLFIAICGEQFNGHDFVDAAKAQGAVACMLDESITTSLPVVKVSNTIIAMGLLAKAVREDIAPSCVGITGSSGKTTVKEMVASILSQKGRVLSTRGNFNNAIGVPLTLLRLTHQDQFAVIEMGASKPGDIDEIAQLVVPNVVLITNISAAHLQGLGSIEGVASVKGELLDYLQDDGVAVLDAESPWLSSWKKKLKNTQQLSTFALINTKADFYATDIKESKETSFIAHTVEGSIEIHLPVPGRHNVKNALAAMAAAISLGASLEQCRNGLSSYSQVAGRLQFSSGLKGCQIIDDSYNANPASLRAAMAVLHTMTGHRVLVLGDMAELGEEAISAHREAGKLARSLGFGGLYATGELSRYTVEEYGAGAEHFTDKKQLSRELALKVTSQWTLLVKGSRSAAMEEIVKNLQKNQHTVQGKQSQGSVNQQKTGTRIC